MSAYRIAERYAKSLLGIAREKDQVEKVHEDVLYFNELVDVRDFKLMLRSPVIQSDDKTAVVDKIMKDKVSEITLEFVHLLIRKGREKFLPEIGKAFIDQYNKLKHITPITIKTAVEVSQDAINVIKSRLEESDQLEKIELTVEVDPELIGGFTLQFDDRMYDASVSRQIKRISKEILDNTYEYKIHG